MSLKSINESFKRLYESEIDEAPIEDEFTDLEISLKNTVDILINNDELHIKKFETAIQDTIENYFPEQSWWEVTDINIFMDLFNHRDPHGTVERILKNLRGEDDFEESLNEARNYDNLEINDKIAKALSRKSFAKKYEKELNDLGIQVKYLDGQGTMLIGPNGKKLSSSRKEIYGPTPPGFDSSHYLPRYKEDDRWEARRLARAQERLAELQYITDTMDISSLSRMYPNKNINEVTELLKADFEKAKQAVEEAVIELKRKHKQLEKSATYIHQTRSNAHVAGIRDTTTEDNVSNSPIDFLGYLTKSRSELRDLPDYNSIEYGDSTPRINKYKNLNARIDSSKSSLDFDKRWYKILEPDQLQAEIDKLEAEFNQKIQALIREQDRNKQKISKSYDAVDAAEKAKDDYLKSLGIR